MHQLLVSRYLRDDSPYRGLILYHGLGVGKTCSAIAILNSLTKNRRAWVLLPASLKGNFVAEFSKCGAKEFSADAHWTKDTTGTWASDLSAPSNFGSLSKDEQDAVLKTVSKRVAAHVRFLSFNGVSRKSIAALSAAGNPFDNSVVCIDECHKFVQSLAVYDDTKDRRAGRMLYDLLYSARNVRVVLLSGTPLINLPVELAYVVNLLRGPQTEHFLRWQRPLRASEIRSAKETLLGNPSVLEARVDAAGATLRFAPKGFVLDQPGSMVVRLDPGTSSRALTTTVRSVQEFTGRGAEFTEHVYDALPTGPDFDRLFVDAGKQAILRKTILMRRMRGCVSYFAARDESLYPSATHRIVLVPMSDEVYTEYAGARVAERKLEEKRAVDENAPTVHRTYSRAACNFVFPTSAGIKKWYKSQVRELMRLEQDAQDGRSSGTSAAAVDREHERVMRQSMKLLRAHPLWTDDAQLAAHSPKFTKVLASLTASPGCAFVYSFFRALEGLGLFSLLLEKRGYARVDVVKSPQGLRLKVSAEGTRPRFMVPVLNTDEGTALLNIFNSRWELLPASLLRDVRAAFGVADNLRGDAVKVVMISGSGAQGISLMNVRSAHILEPHWNSTQLEQVAGRAVRMFSHSRLPEAERNVRIYTYVTTFSEHQRALKEFRAMQAYDKGLTSDEHLLEISKRKEKMLGQLQALMRRVSVDCKVHAAVHGKGDCYVAPTVFGTDLPMMPPNIDHDVEDPARVVQVRRFNVTIRGEVVPVAIADGIVYGDSDFAKRGSNASPLGRVDRTSDGKETITLGNN